MNRETYLQEKCEFLQQQVEKLAEAQGIGALPAFPPYEDWLRYRRVQP